MGEGPAGLPLEAPQPPPAGTAAEFTAALRALRAWSGLTYRQVEGKTTALGEPIPTSTIATTLGRATLPRESFVAAFTRACGLGDDEVRLWLDARARIAIGDQAQPGDHTHGDEDADGEAEDVPRPEEPVAPGFRWWRRAGSVVAAMSVGVLGTLGVQALLSNADTRHPAPPGTESVAGLRILAAGSWARIHPARTPELCVTEGKERRGRYETEIAVQRPCAQTVSPRTFIEPLGDNAVQIQWHHPKHSIGCLTVLLEGVGSNLVEPREDCADDNPAQRFRIEPIGPPAAAHFRIRPAAGDQCLSLRDQDTTDGAEIVRGRCSGAADQEFLIELIPPP
ncbi:helix-turn-helix domain-containing protein [Actinosynnema sp. NPDC050436]|uniref:helix-turn-helix domain-containing protein n=1 Tax=Actinosynnema sp. NPDC050436 TaxID=3155659 RepID=UPI0033F0C4D4